MHVIATIWIFAPGRTGSYAEMATIRREFDTASIIDAATRCRNLIAINRTGNPTYDLRFKAEAVGEGKTWRHDEMDGDPLIAPHVPRPKLTIPTPIRKNA